MGRLVEARKKEHGRGMKRLVVHQYPTAMWYFITCICVHIGVENGWSSIDERGQSDSSDSRTETGYIECVFHPTYSMEPEEHEPKESTLSCLRIHHNETVDSASVDEHSEVVDDDFAHSLSEEQTGPISSFITRNEKTEIVKTMGHHEIDNYVDALNTIESESETDLDCQTKREVKKSSNLNEEGTQEDGVHGLAVIIRPSTIKLGISPAADLITQTM
ncbi:hypothetical protein LOK49_LG15G01535 [Camellia lanceoleosa]|uniref:Uncharacterized protein n=1 Tax=Camellia lanceoleosa TaxID=1840588 RepID=A0ACC0F4Q8_9ERIC|nr:hypothetical protein LOK49_LG15G01535 [Camellia lanceoleosa]